MKGIQNTSNDTYRQLMGNGLRYIVPKFQRDYSWENEHWDDLWQDMLLLWNKEEEEHYMGYLVLQTTDNKKFTVIDGQQRLATLSIVILGVLKLLTKWIGEGIEKEDNKIRLDAYRNAYIGTLDTVALISDNKLKLNRTGDDYYRNNLVLLKELPLRNTNVSEKGMRSCFLWFYKKLSRKFQTGTALAEFVESIVDKLFFTVITVTDEINAFKVFETLNARGIQLSSSDLLKNYLFSKVDIATDTSKNEIEELEKLWSRIIGKLGSGKFEDYLRYYWNSKNKTVRKNQLYRTVRNSITDKKAAFELVRKLDDTADLFMAIQDPQSSYWDASTEIRKQLNDLKRFRIKQAYSLLMAGYKNLDHNLSFQKLVKAISIISFRYNVIGGLNPNEQEEIYNKTANSIYKNKRFEIKDLQPVYVSDKSFQDAFSTKPFKSNSNNHKIVKYILAKIEQYEINIEINIESDNYTIEHILPKSTDESWGDFSDEQINRSVYRLGNLTLLEKKLNREAGVLSYEDKKMFFEKSNCNLTKNIPEHYETWTEEKIVARQKELAKAAKSIWKIQDLA